MIEINSRRDEVDEKGGTSKESGWRRFNSLTRERGVGPSRGAMLLSFAKPLLFVR